MGITNVYMELQKLFIDNKEDLPINEIVTFINQNNLFSNELVSLSTMRLISSIVYCYPALFDQTVHILSLIDKISINLFFISNLISNKGIMNRSLVIYVLLCLSNHIVFGDIKVELNYENLIFINPIYMSKFPNCPRLTNICDFNMIAKMSNEEKIKIRNKLHSSHPIVQSIIDDNVDLLNELISTSNFDVNDKIPKSIFEIHSILESAQPIQYAALLGSINCFKYLLHKTSSIDYKKLMEFGIAGGNSEIIHIIENYVDVFNQELLNLAILYMRNDLIEYILNNYDLKINCESYFLCIYASNYEALLLLQEFEKYDENKIGINSIKEFISYNCFMCLILSIIGFDYIKSLEIDIVKSSYQGRRFDVLNYINEHKLIDDDSKYILEPYSMVLSHNEEQVINDFQSFKENAMFHSYFEYYFDDYYDYYYLWYGDYDDEWGYRWPGIDDGNGIDNYERTHKKRFTRNKCNRSTVNKKYNKINCSQRLKKKCLKKNMNLDIKEYFDN